MKNRFRGSLANAGWQTSSGLVKRIAAFPTLQPLVTPSD